MHHFAVSKWSPAILNLLNLLAIFAECGYGIKVDSPSSNSAINLPF